MSATYLGYRMTRWLSTRLPAPVAFRWAERLADLRWRCSAEDRAAVQGNLSAILGASFSERTSLIREVFRNFGRYLVEFFSIHQTPEPEVRVEGYDHFKTAQERRRGMIVLTGHLGNWEVGAVVIRRMGFPISVVALPHDDPRMDRLFNEQRQRCGVDVIPLGPEAARCSLKSLRNGRLLGLLGDLEFGRHGLAVSPEAWEMTLPRGPAVLSLRGQVPVVPTFLIREGAWKFRLCFEPPIWPEAQEATEASVRALTHTYAAVFGRYLKRFPEQWLMFNPMAHVPPSPPSGRR